MEAKERAFTFMATQSYYDIPFFQREYVWDEDNWSELLNNFYDFSDSHFLGSIILKQVHTKSGEKPRHIVIDGQQRLTTLSILVRACYDRLLDEKEHYSPKVVDNFEKAMHQLLFVSPDMFSENEDIKIHHSKLDKPDYQAVITGEYSELDIEKEYKKSGKSKIARCYLYFRNELNKKKKSDIENLWKILTTDESKYLVNIDLGADENEQKIFDTVNSFGVRLSSSDTIKNALFQQYIERMRASQEKDIDEKASSLYERTWDKAFGLDDDCRKYWGTVRRYGRLSRDNLEVFLYAYAVINDFFDPSADNMVTLPQRYKSKIDDMDIESIEQFLVQIQKYAAIYRKYFNIFDNDTLLSYTDYQTRLLHLCHALDVSTFYPYILKMLYQCESKEISENQLKERLFRLENYIVLNAICGGSTKNYNNECVQLVRNRKKTEELVKTCDAINRYAFDAGLRNMRQNKTATAILFWVELYNRENKYADIKELKYTYTLEHIMPQKWQTYWSFNDVPVYSDKEKLIENEREAKEVRRAAIYQIGNMTLLNSKLNTALSNNTFKKKVHGDGKKTKHTMSTLADLYLTREVIKEDSWDERKIRRRTEQIQEVIEKVWKVEFPEDESIHINVERDDPRGSFIDSFQDLLRDMSYAQVLKAINNSSNSEDEKSILKKCLYEYIEEIYINYGIRYKDPSHILDMKARDVIEELGQDTFSVYTKAFLAAIDGEVEESIKSFNELFVTNRKEREKDGEEYIIRERDLYHLCIKPVKNATPGFYKRLPQSWEEIKTEPVVESLCECLDEYYECKEPKDRIEILVPLMREYPHSIVVNMLIGFDYYLSKMWEKSIECLGYCIDNRQIAFLREEDILFDLAYACSKVKRREDAINYYEESLELFPDDPMAINNLAYELYLVKRHEESLKRYKECLSYEDDHTYAANNIVRPLIALKRFDELKSYIDNPPRKLRKDIVELVEKALSGAVPEVGEETYESDEKNTDSIQVLY